MKWENEELAQSLWLQENQSQLFLMDITYCSKLTSALQTDLKFTENGMLVSVIKSSC